MTPAELFQRWMTDLPAYCRSGLFIQMKSKKVEPLRLNPVQLALHEALQAQLSETGRVRALVLKARQMGVSTYVAARFFAHCHLARKDSPTRTYVLAHDDKTARKLLRMYSLMWEQHAAPLRVERVRSNEHEQHLANGSIIEVNTASTPTGGRGGTVDRFHGSEVAFWDHAESHAVGSFQQLSQSPGTEMILESTADGATGAFFERWKAAEVGRGPFIGLFYPWTIMPEYETEPRPGFTLTHDKPNDVVLSEVEYAEKHGCTMAQMAWRRDKIYELSAKSHDGALMFTQEYPATAQEAFLGGSGSSFISSAVVEAARLRPTTIVWPDSEHPLILGLDPAPAHGQASSALVWRKGRICYRIERMHGLDPMQLAMRVYEIFTQEGAARLCVDESEGVGHHVVSHLSRLSGTGGHVVGVRFGERAHSPDIYANVRAEIWSKMAKWLSNGAAIVDELPPPGQASLASELLAPHAKSGQERRVLLESKDQMAQRGVASPDGADALAVTFYFPDPSPNAHGFVVAPMAMPGEPLPSHHTGRNMGHAPPDDFHVAPMRETW